MRPETFRRFCFCTLISILTAPALRAAPTVDTITLQPPNVRLGGSFIARFSGNSLSDQTYFDVRVAGPDGADVLVLNWQRGASAAHGVPIETAPGTWKITGMRAHEDSNDHSQPLVSGSATLTVSALTVTGLELNPGSIGLEGGSFSATFSGTNLTTDTYFDVQYRTPCSDQDLVALNWQKGTSATHPVTAGTPSGIWTITGVWAHQDINDHSSDFASRATVLRIEPPNSIPFNGRVLAIAVARSRPATVYASTIGLAMYKSCDSGQNWISVSAGLPKSDVLTLAIDPSNPDVVYAGTGAGIAKSVDGGGSWNAANTDPAVAPVRALTIDPQNPATIYAGTAGHGLYKSLDGGLRWTLYDFGTPAGAVFQSIAVEPVNSSVVYAGTDGSNQTNGRGRIFKTIDGGGHWEDSWTNVPANVIPQTIYSLIVDPRNVATIYAGTINPERQGSTSDQAGVFKSTDGGRTWSGLPGIWGPSHRYIRSLVIDPMNTSNIYATSSYGDFWKSTDAGASGKASRLPSLGSYVLAIDPLHPSTLYAGESAGNGIFKSTDGGATWKVLDVR